MNHSLEFWFDFGCPYSRMSLAELRRFMAEEGIEVAVKLHALRLDTAAPADYGKTTVENLCDHLGITEDEALAMLQQVVDTGASVGVDFDFRRARGASTLDAHRLVKVSAQHGVHLEFAEAVFTAHFEHGLLISDYDVLVELGVGVGLDASDVRGVLKGDDFTGEVAHDEAMAKSHGIERTPHFRFGNGVSVSGLQTRSDWRQLLVKG